MLLTDSNQSIDEGKLFILSAWEELFYSFTPDSHQPRLHNVASLIDELLETGKLWKENDYWKTHISKIKDELKLAIKTEEMILSRIPTFRSRSKQLVLSQTPQALVAGAGILCADRNFYEEAFKEWASEAIKKLPRNKSSALEAIRRLASFAFQQGKEADDVWDSAMVSTPNDLNQTHYKLTEISFDNIKDYECTLSIIGEIDGMHGIARKQGYTIVAKNSLHEDYTKTISTPGDRTLHIQMEVQGKSIRDAVSSARKKLGIDIGFVSLYKNPSELRIHSTALVSYRGKDQVFQLSDQAFRRLYPRTKAKEDINNAIQLMKESVIDQRVLAAVEQLALASSSSDTRTRFVNIWSALETLAGSHEGGTTLERVCELIVPLVTSRKVHKTTRYMTILCQKFAKNIGSSDYGSGFKSNCSSIQLGDMLLTLTSPKNDSKIKGLLKFADQPLLRNHLYSVWESFHNPSCLKKRLEESKQRLEWQLARIYRARNLLVHQGIEVSHIVPLLDNLQYYASMLTQRLVHELKQHPKWTVRDVIEYWNGRMNHTLVCLERESSCLTIQDFLETDDKTQLWK